MFEADYDQIDLKIMFGASEMYQSKPELVEFANKHHIKFCDYTKDSRFSIEDFTWEMPDHMNALGAMKFSRILDEDVVKVQL